MGGLVGRQQFGGIIFSSYAKGSIYGKNGRDYVGGLIGVKVGGRVVSSYATGSVDGGKGSDFVGGLIGYSGGSIISSYATGSVNGGEDGDHVGGLVGYAMAHILSNYSTGSVAGEAGSDKVGGLVGHHDGEGVIVSSYAVGVPDGGVGTDYVGRLVGLKSSSATITESYGFGTPQNSENTESDGSPPNDISQASSLVSGELSSESNAAGETWSEKAWDFGDDTQAPRLKYVDNFAHKEGDTTTVEGEYICSTTTAFLPSIEITCGETLLPSQN